MVDLTDRIAFHGTVVSRGTEAINELKRIGERCGRFTHNDCEIIVYQDSTDRELCYQYELKLYQSSYLRQSNEPA